MRLSALIILLTLSTCSSNPAFALNCARVPLWLHYYSKAQVAQVAADIGMTRLQIERLLKCL